MAAFARHRHIARVVKITNPMPELRTDVAVKPGQEVKAGEKLAVDQPIREFR